MGEIYTDLNSDFPLKVSTMNRVQDVTLSAKPYVDLYNQYYSQGDFENANKVINEHPELLTMMLNMNLVNQIIDEIKATQRTFKDDVESYIFTVVKNKGTFSKSTKYVKYNLVYFENLPYMAIADDVPIGIEPTNSAYWYPLAIKGEQGSSGAGLSPRGAYVSGTTYYQYDMVLYDYKLWYAIKDNPVGSPNNANKDWALFFEFNAEVLGYDNSESGLTATTMQDAIDEVNVKTNSKAEIIHKHIVSDITDFPTSMPANGGNSTTVNGHTVDSNVPSNAKFTDTIYTHPSTHPASMITGLPTSLPANGGNSDTVDGYHVSLTIGTWGLKPISAGTGDMTAGVTGLSQGNIYLVYE